MPINSLTAQQRNFINSFCSRTLSDTELRLFNVKEGRVRLRDRIADVFNLRAIPDSELRAKYNALSGLLSSVKTNTNQWNVASQNLNKLAAQLNDSKVIPASLHGHVYEGW